MVQDAISLGDFVRCQHTAKLKKPILGKVVRFIREDAVVEVLNFHFSDRTIVSACDFHVIIPVNDLKKVKVTRCQKGQRPG